MAKADINGRIIAESNETINLEGNIYFPKESLKKGILIDSEKRYTCPWKGDAVYHSIKMGDEVIKDGTWTYPEPKEKAGEIKGHFAFDKSTVNITE